MSDHIEVVAVGQSDSVPLKRFETAILQNENRSRDKKMLTTWMLTSGIPLTQAQGQCILPGLAIVDTIVHITLFLIPVVTVGLFATSYLVERYTLKKEAFRIEYYVLLLLALLIRLSIVGIIIGILIFSLFGVIKPGPVSSCYNM